MLFNNTVSKRQKVSKRGYGKVQLNLSHNLFVINFFSFSPPLKIKKNFFRIFQDKTVKILQLIPHNWSIHKEKLIIQDEGEDLMNETV